MKKVRKQPAEQKTDTQVQGGVSLWERITGNPEFQKRKRQIQARYRLPLKYDIRFNRLEWNQWMGYEEKPTGRKAKRGQAFLKDVRTLFKKFEVPEGWYEELIAEIGGQVIDGLPSDTMGSPTFEVYRDEAGHWKWRCIITPETDLTNPVYLDMIRNQQKQYAGDPPRPARDKTNPRKLDWRPVYEWHKRHPLFTLREIAEKLGYPAQTVRRKIAELEIKE